MTDPNPNDWCYTCEQFHGPMGWGDGCMDDRDLFRAQARHLLPWAPSFGWLTGRRCSARLRKEQAGPWRRWGRCELRFGHVAADEPLHVDHALEYGLIVLRWSAWSAPEPYVEEGAAR